MSTNSGSRGLLGLPVEVMFYILDHTELCSLYWLSQTCRTMRYLAKRDFRTLANTNFEDRAEFLLGLAYVMPDHYFCGKCCMLHIFNRHAPSIKSRLCWDYSINHRRSCATGYNLQHQHVQLALKYNRLGGFYRYAAANIMQPYQQTCSNGSLGPILHFSATPEIKNGRFILHEEWKLQADFPASLVPSYIFVPICSHIDLLGGRSLMKEDGRASWSLIRHLTPLENGEVERSRAPRGSCKTCSTSYDFSVSKENGAVVNATHDYGSFSSLDEWKRRSRKRRPHGQEPIAIDYVFHENDSGDFEEADWRRWYNA
ncbi:f-box domain protein [Fusarium sp. NRRL 25303]|nr:f-box domain protein [Fusarium sp. NRRL 25303]